MKILVSVVGIGLGHATRSEAIVKSLEKQGDSVKIITWGDAYEFFKKKGYNVSDTGGYDYKGQEYTFSVMLNVLDSFRDPTKLKRDYYQFVKLADEFKPDKVVSDTDPNAFYYSHRRNLKNYMLSNLPTTINNYERIPKSLRTNDLMMQHFMVKRLMDFIAKRTHKIFVPSFESKVRYEENVRYTDLVIRKRSGELPPEDKLRIKMGIPDEFYLVTVGGSEIEKPLFGVLRNVLPQFKNKRFIVSSNNVTTKIEKTKNMIIVPFIPNILEYLKISKGVIAPAGHSTISEAICYQKPILAIPLRNHVEQLVNAALVEKEGYGSACFLKGKINPEEIKKGLEHFFAHEKEYQKNLSTCGLRGKGADEIANWISRD
ncbi:MAG: glycosyltransferase family protein [Candidatus Nanoarchaeia archaeon]|nr:glycosyltransferase family protein [Candidatus Nanoarchaeia archaeon]MDD5239704.1 glycosyltransferase family protein [Candidatus Nanoarchaeia archaeon]